MKIFPVAILVLALLIAPLASIGEQQSEEMVLYYYGDLGYETSELLPKVLNGEFLNEDDFVFIDTVEGLISVGYAKSATNNGSEYIILEVDESITQIDGAYRQIATGSQKMFESQAPLYHYILELENNLDAGISYITISGDFDFTSKNGETRRINNMYGSLHFRDANGVEQYLPEGYIWHFVAPQSFKIKLEQYGDENRSFYIGSEYLFDFSQEEIGGILEINEAREFTSQMDDRTENYTVALKVTQLGKIIDDNQ